MERARRVAVTVEQSWHRVPGGTATSTIGTLRALRDRTDLDLIGVAARHAHPPPAPFLPPIPVAHLPVPRRLLYETWHGVRWPKVERATGPVDVVHATAIAIPPTDAPLVVTIHDLAFLADPTQPTRHGLRFFTRGTELARRHATLVLVPSEATREECRAAGFDDDRLRVVPWGVDPGEVTPVEVDEVRARHGLDRPYVLFVGTIEPRKNLVGVLSAVERIADLGVDLALVGPEGWNEDLSSGIERLREAGVGVHRLGFVPASDLGPLYRGCAAFCFPSVREGFGMPVLDAMAHGAPVVTSLGTATAEVAGDAGLLVDPHDHRAIGDALRRIVEDPALADELRARGRDRAGTFTWQRTADLTASAYAEAAP